MAQKQARSQETTDAIMRAAMKLGSLKGINAVTVREICAEAGVSIGAFYHHFSSRQDLFHRAFESFDRALNRKMAQFDETKSPLEMLTELLMFQVTYVSREGRGVISSYYRTILNDTTHAAVNPDRSYYRAAHAYVQRLADAGQLRPEYQPQQIAELCISFIRGCLIDWCLHDQNYDVIAHTRRVLPILIRGFIQESP